MMHIKLTIDQCKHHTYFKNYEDCKEHAVYRYINTYALHEHFLLFSTPYTQRMKCFLC